MLIKRQVWWLQVNSLAMWIDNKWNESEVVPVCELTWNITIHDKRTESMTTWSTGFCLSEQGWRQHVHLKYWHNIPEIDSHHHHGHCFEGLTYFCLRMFSSRGWASSSNSKLKPTRCNVSWFINFYRRSTCFRRFFRPSSGAHNCTYSFRCCQLLLAAIMDEI